ANFEYCKFLYASTAIYETCCGPGKTTVKNSRFTANNTAMGGYTGGTSIVNSCTFERNTYAVTQADKSIHNSKFVSNQYGLYETERIDVANSTFSGNSEVALYGGRGTVSNCTIENNQIGVKAFFEGFTITDSNISNNGNGIITGSDYLSPITNNKICNNSTYNIELQSNRNFNASGNCFCSSDSTAIENKIYDGFDDNSKGLVNYSIYTDDCATLTRDIDKTAPRTIYLRKENSPYEFAQDLIIRSTETLVIEPGVELRFGAGKRLEIRGQLSAVGNSADSISFTALN